MDLLIEFAKTGLGIGCVIREFVQEELKDGSLIELPLEAPIRNRTIGFAYHPSAMTRTMNDFVQFCSDYSVSDRNYLCAVSGARGTRNVCIFVPWNADHR